jgi:hypothetical protein
MTRREPVGAVRPSEDRIEVSCDHFEVIQFEVDLVLPSFILGNGHVHRCSFRNSDTGAVLSATLCVDLGRSPLRIGRREDIGFVTTRPIFLASSFGIRFTMDARDGAHQPLYHQAVGNLNFDYNQAQTAVIEFRAEHRLNIKTAWLPTAAN